MMIAGIRLLIMGVDNFIQPIRHVGWVTTSANVTDISETVIKNNFLETSGQESTIRGLMSMWWTVRTIQASLAP